MAEWPTKSITSGEPSERVKSWAPPAPPAPKQSFGANIASSSKPFKDLRSFAKQIA